jgi:restriction system protein
LSKAGLIVSPRRGWFIASDSGRALLARNLTRIDVKLLSEYPSFRDFYQGDPGSKSTAGAEEIPEARSMAICGDAGRANRTSLSRCASSLRTELLQRILQNSPGFFEQVIVDLLVAMGYGGSHRIAAKQLGRSGDGGVDGVIDEDRLGLDRVYVQAKRYAESSAVGRPEVQGFVGSLVGLGATKGVFVTTSTFSKHATDYVLHLAQRVILIDGPRLADLMIEHNVGVRVGRSIEFKRLDEDFFSEED